MMDGDPELPPLGYGLLAHGERRKDENCDDDVSRPFKLHECFPESCAREYRRFPLFQCPEHDVTLKVK